MQLSRMRGNAFVHIGTHKTGTTSIQALLATNAHALRTAGVHIPAAGRTNARFAGHHNIAWELGGDRRFDPQYGTLDTLVAEIAAERARTVCLSSEDFESLHGNEHALRLLRDALNAAGYAVKIVVYLRPQADYLESLYAEICATWNVSFADFLDGVVADGGYGGTAFDYDHLTSAFAAVFGSDRVLVRAYHAADPADRLLSTFVDTIAGQGAFDHLALPERLNAMRTFESVVEARARITGGSVRSPIAASQAFDPLELADIARISARFHASNERVASAHGLRLHAATPAILIRELITEIFRDRDAYERKALIRSIGTAKTGIRV